jgi:sigma-B regulation protein RsbU (phosphoserine phosphatase)
MNNLHPQNDEIRQLKSAISELTLLNDLALAASSSLEVDQVLDLIVEKSIKALQAEQGSIMLVTPQPDSPLRTLIRQADISQTTPGYKVGTHISGWVLKYRKPLLIGDLSSDERFRVSEEESRIIKTLIAVPITSKGDLTGVLIMTNKKNDSTFTNEDQRLLTIIAAQSAQLIRNSQLQSEALEKKRLEYQLELAQNMQRQLLPEKDPELTELDICAFFKPHRSVSGDYYDYFRLSDNQFGVLIADVSGHGPSAALVMTLVKGIVHSLIHTYQSPAQVLSQADKILSKIIPADMFVTMFFLMFDMDKRCIVYANAGHTPLIGFCYAKQKSLMVPAGDCPLNTVSNYNYKNEQIKFDNLDSFLIYTDGLSESTNNNGEMFGMARLGDALQKYHNFPAEKIVSQIISDVTEHLENQDYSDDIIIIALKIIHLPG